MIFPEDSFFHILMPMRFFWFGVRVGKFSVATGILRLADTGGSVGMEVSLSPGEQEARKSARAKVMDRRETCMGKYNVQDLRSAIASSK